MPSPHALEHQSDQLSIHRLDWLKAAIIGLSDSEVAILKAIADIDGDTANYMRQVLRTQVPMHSVSNTFLTLWNKEEFENCQDMAKLFACCGIDLARERAKDKERQSTFSQWISRGFRKSLGRLAPRTATALHLSWAASQKYMLTQAYRRLANTTTNPILRSLSLRIAKQERRNFHWYFSGARVLLLRAPGSRAIVRLLFKRVWYPLSSKTQSKKQAQRLLDLLFPGTMLFAAMNHLDAVMAQLPGFSASDFATCFATESPRAPELLAQRA